MFKSLIKLARPHQYLKNAFVLVGPLFGGSSLLEIWRPTALAFVSFCALASAVYICNDIFDVEADRSHPIKCKRPLASGAVGVGVAWTFATLLVAFGLLCAALIGPAAFAIVATYAIMQYGYSLAWKHVVIVDVFIIAFGFMLRIFMGTLGLGIPPSNWLLLCGLMVTLFLGFTKRRAELMLLDKATADNSLSTRKVLDDYSPAMIEQFTAICAACTILSYSLYTVAPVTVETHHTAYLILTVPFVIYGIFRYLYLLHCEQYGADTSKELFRDRHLLATAVGWALSVVLILTFRP